MALDTDSPRLSTERAVLGNQARREGGIEVECGPNDLLVECVILEDSVQDFLLLLAVVGERLKLLIQGRKLVMRLVRTLPVFLVFGERKSVVIWSEECYAREYVLAMYAQWQGNAYLWEVSFKRLT